MYYKKFPTKKMSLTNRSIIIENRLESTYDILSGLGPSAKARPPNEQSAEIIVLRSRGGRYRKKPSTTAKAYWAVRASMVRKLGQRIGRGWKSLSARQIEVRIAATALLSLLRG